MRSGREDDSFTPVYRLDLETGRVGLVETVWTCIRNVLASSVSRGTDSADFYGFPGSGQFPLGHGLLLPDHFQFIDQSSIPRYTV